MGFLYLLNHTFTHHTLNQGYHTDDTWRVTCRCDMKSMVRTARVMDVSWIFFPLSFPLSVVTPRGKKNYFIALHKKNKKFQKTPDTVFISEESHQVDPPRPKNYDTSVAEMKLPLLLTSRSRTTVAQTRWQTKNAYYVTGCTVTDQVTVGNTMSWVLQAQVICSCPTHFQSTFSVIHRLSRN
jgi:hypothetical protein